MNDLKESTDVSSFVTSMVVVFVDVFLAAQRGG